MARSRDQTIEMIPIDEINILNPRARNKRTHREIVDNIESIGLKRPVTVTRRAATDTPLGYDLVCGEGRLEAFRLLGETNIPAIVIEASEADCLVMSLVENVARRQHRPIDIMHEIGSLNKRGYSDAEIGGKIGLSPAYVAMIVVLLERGEERLVAAVESGLIPVSFAIDIARADHAEVQDVLMDAYAAGQIKGRKLSSVRRLLDQRVKRSKTVPDPGLGLKNPGRKLTSKDLMHIYQREAEKQRLLVKKSEFTQAKLLFVVEALKDLLADEGFRSLLRAEQLETMPRALTARIVGELVH
jgi:ParB family chromosome partitioning protein